MLVFDRRGGGRIRGCIGFEVTGKPAPFAFDVTVTSNAYVFVDVSLRT